jgi:hypothetical protein
MLMSFSDTLHKARVVRVKRALGESGWFFATSPDVKGLLVTQPTLDALEDAIPSAISDLYEADGHNVVVTRLDNDDGDLRSWVVIPAKLAERELALRMKRTR